MPDRNDDQPRTPGPRSGPASDAVRLHRARIVERLAGSTWHELAQPLHALASLASLLRVGPSAADELAADPELLADAVDRTQRLARTFTALARGRGHSGGLRELLDDVTALAGDDLVDVEVVNDVPPDARQPDVDPGVLLLVTASLLVDAVDSLGGPRAARGRLRWSLEPAAAATVRGPGLELVLEHDGDGGPGTDVAILRAIVADAGGSLRQVTTSPGGRSILKLPAERPGERPPAGQRG